MFYEDKISFIDGSRRRNHNPKKRYRKEEPYLCPKCNRVWQPMRDFGSPPDYLKEFPKIGCTIRTCLGCKRRSKHGNNNSNA